MSDIIVKGRKCDNCGNHALKFPCEFCAALSGKKGGELLARRICEATRAVPIDHHKGDNCPRCDSIEAALRAVGQQEPSTIREALLKRAEELHIISNGSGLPRRYKDCYLHVFETCTSPECVEARKVAGQQEQPREAVYERLELMAEIVHNGQHHQWDDWRKCDHNVCVGNRAALAAAPPRSQENK